MNYFKFINAIITLFLINVFFVGCNNDLINKLDAQNKTKPATEVYVQGQKVAGTRAGTTQIEDAYFFIRVDNRIPGAGSYPSSAYFPQTAIGESVFASGNKGTVDLSYPSWSNNSTFPMYVYDTSGIATEKAIGNQPTLKDLLKANKNFSYDVSKINTESLKVIWYIAKKQDGVWHVDGVLTDKSTEDATDVPGIGEDIAKDNKDLDNKKEESTIPAESNGNIEVDIHQQEHKDWQEIKTSVHVRDLVDKVTVEIPLEYENITEADDFAIRTYDLQLGSKVFINGTEYALDSTNPVKVTVEHQADKAVFTIECTDAKYLAALRKEYGDGVTVEIHTYGKGLTNEQIWEKLKKATVTTNPSDYKYLIYKGATSAYFSK